MTGTTFASSLDAIRLTSTRWTWSCAIGLARKAVLNILSGLSNGTLIIVDIDNERYSFGDKIDLEQIDVHKSSTKPFPKSQVVVKRDSFWLRLFLFADMGFAESYMLGDFDCTDLTSFFELFVLNKDSLDAGRTVFWSIRNVVTRLGRSTNSLANSRLNTAAHYDISNDMFAAFLSPDMTYSCPIWQITQPVETQGNPETLEHAQQTKILRFVEGAKIKSTDHVLEIGTGWGSFAIEAVKRTGCRVTSITLSGNQKDLAEKRIRAAGLTDSIEVKLMDYRELLSQGRSFDKIVSIEMLEAVGEAHLSEYFKVIDKLLKKDGGIAMFQCITMPEAQHKADEKKREFASEYIFPGGYLPSTMQLLSHISVQSRGTLTVERVENIGGHYSKALRLWRENFVLQFEEKARPALLDNYPGMSLEEIEVFRRKWEYYFSYCEAGFLTRTLNDMIITVARPGAMDLINGIPS